jgi:Putative zinc-finger
MVVHCEQVWGEISNYVEGEVDPALRAAMDEHLATCQRCASVLAGVRNVVGIYGDERMLEVPVGYSNRLEKKLARSAHEQKRAKRWPNWAVWLIPVGAVALILIGFQVFHSFTPGVPSQRELAQLEHNIPPDLVVVAATDTKVFHLAGCGLIQGKEKDKLKTMTAKEAMKEGYVPCTRCLRKYLDVATRRRLGLDLEMDREVDDERLEAAQTGQKVLVLP